MRLLTLIFTFTCLARLSYAQHINYDHQFKLITDKGYRENNIITYTTHFDTTIRARSFFTTCLEPCASGYAYAENFKVPKAVFLDGDSIVIIDSLTPSCDWSVSLPKNLPDGWYGHAHKKTKKIIRKYYLQNGLFHGLYRDFYDNGETKAITSYRQGVIHGKEINYHRNGIIEMIRNFDDGKLNGPFLKYFKNGKLHYRGTNLSGRYHEEYVQYYENGILEYRKYYDKGKLTGLYENFDTTGLAIKKTEYIQDRKQGKESIYTKGKLYTVSTFENDTLHGSKTRYLNNRIEVFQYEKGILEGPFLEYRADSSYFSKGNYADNKLSGAFYFYYPNGSVHESMQYEQGNIKNLVTSYDTLGNMTCTSDFINNKETGKRYYFNLEGDNIAISNYDNGHHLKTVYLDKKLKKAILKRTWVRVLISGMSPEDIESELKDKRIVFSVDHETIDYKELTYQYYWLKKKDLKSLKENSTFNVILPY